ncbi:MAG: SpoIID/LytB domain-containing protein [Clostridiales bacterium]|nr:SpoIID/LytB domain-containing protein [Clostridiales bacterium]
MRNRKRWETFLAAIEIAALAGFLILSFYLLYGYLQTGEQAVNGTAVYVESDEEPESDKEENRNTLSDAQSLNQSLVVTADTAAVSVRVRILDDSYSDDLFDEIVLCSQDGFSVERGTCLEDGTFASAFAKETMEANETYVISANDLVSGEVLRFASLGEGALAVTSLSRADGLPEYSGELYIYRLENGLALVNELPLEEYLCAVVSSEMPSYYPEEALKAQAVCARTYALSCMEEGASGDNTSEDRLTEGTLNEKKLADLNDSASFQVYNNRKPTAASENAVNATCGEVLLTKDVQYYSTSVLSEHRDDLSEEEAFHSFLEEEPGMEAEYGSPWLRWQVKIPMARILENLDELYSDQLEEINSDAAVSAERTAAIDVAARDGNGQVLTIAVTVGEETLKIEGEYAIRQVLSPGDVDVTLMDGTTVSGMQLLPSAFFFLEYEADESDADTEDLETISIYGGGYGHGNGMSQCGAAQMAADGATYRDILEYYYGDDG